MRRLNGGHRVSTPRVAIVGAGIGGLTAAIKLGASGARVTLFERAASVGGKVRQIEVDGVGIDSGPTVLTMKPVFDEIFAAAGTSLEEHLVLQPLDVIARHAWTGGQALDLFSDPARTADAIGVRFGRREAQAYLGFCERARSIHATLDDTFIRNTRPSLPDLVRRVGPLRLGALAGISPFTTLAKALAEHFAEPKLRQLFGRYATYCGSSPYLAPATLMLVTDVERQGVWAIEGGMRRLIEALARLAAKCGVAIRCDADVSEIRVGREGASGVSLRGGEVVEANAVVANADASALGLGLLGSGAASASPPMKPAERSLSAMTWSLRAEPEGFSLAHHNVFFSDDYAAEFEALRAGRLPDDPTVYVCSQDRGFPGEPRGGPERLFCIVNAPPNGDRHAYSPEETGLCERQMHRRLERCGLTVRHRPESSVVTSPADFDRLFPGTGGALYGRTAHGWMASFQRPESRTRIPNLYLAGGSTHPGPGMPMAAISGMLAAESLISDLASMRTYRPAAMLGGTSTR